MSDFTMDTLSENICRRCRFYGSDIRLSACGCTLHTRCIPLDLLISEVVKSPGASKERLNFIPIETASEMCPFCRTQVVSQIEILPVSISLIDKAVEIRRANSLKDDPNKSTITEKTVEDTTGSLPESSLLMFSSKYDPSNECVQHGSLWDAEFQRTGRWTKEEAEYADVLFKTFEEGFVPLSPGLRLKDFLCQMLLCKGTRLTKKFKNAKLSMRSYTLKVQSVPEEEYFVLSTLQENFLNSITDEALRLEVCFFLKKTWRTFFSDFCVQVGYKMLDATKWLESVELIERRAAEAEDLVRLSHRMNIGKALLKCDEVQSTTVNYKPDVVHSLDLAQTYHPIADLVTSSYSSFHTKTSIESDIDRSYDESLFTSGINMRGGGRDNRNTCSDNTTVSEEYYLSSSSANDFINVFEDQSEYTSQSTYLSQRQTFAKRVSPLSEAIVSLVESNNFPFQSVEIWATSQGSTETCDTTEVMLHQGGYSCRKDLDEATTKKLLEFGDYSAQFLFNSKTGFPGHVYQRRSARWDTDVGGMERSLVYKDYGIKTMLGIPVEFKTVGCLVVVLYALTNIPYDANIVRTFQIELSNHLLEPKWQIFIESEKSNDKWVKYGDNHNRINRAQGSISGSPGASNNPRTESASCRSAAITESSCDRSTSSYSMENCVEGYPDFRREELSLASLLGNNLPCLGSKTGKSSKLTVEAYISLRLLLLRDPSRRSEMENNVIVEIRLSYQGYLLSEKWNEYDLAELIVKDWSHLRRAIK